MPVASETRQKLLHDYRNKVETSAAALAKKYNISKSSVYRILSAEAAAAPVPKAVKSVAPTFTKANAPPSIPKLVVKEADDDDNESASSVSSSFYRRSDRFADDLGLTTGTLKNSEEEGVADPEVREADIDMALGRILGEDTGRKPLDIAIPDFLNAPPPKRPAADDDTSDSVVHVSASLNMNTGLIDRDDTTQRIIFIAENFGPLVAGITGPDTAAFTQRLAEKNDLELTRLLRTLERTRSVGNIAAGFKQLFFFTGSATEAATRLIGMKTDGFVDRLREQERELTMIMKEIAMNQWERVRALDSPEMRLGSLFCLTLLQTDAVNRMKQAVKPDARVPANVVSAHADL